MWWVQVAPTVSRYIAVRFLNNIIKKTLFRSIMGTSVSQLSDHEREWYDYFMQNYSKDQMIVKYIKKIQELNMAQGGRDGILYD